MPHICNDDCHAPGGPLCRDAEGNSTVNETAPDPLVIMDDAGNVIFRLRDDGEAELPDPRKAKMAAAIFWREVIHMAQVMRIPVKIVGAEENPS